MEKTIEEIIDRTSASTYSYFETTLNHSQTGEYSFGIIIERLMAYHQTVLRETLSTAYQTGQVGGYKAGYAEAQIQSLLSSNNKTI